MLRKKLKKNQHSSMQQNAAVSSQKNDFANNNFQNRKSTDNVSQLMHFDNKATGRSYNDFNQSYKSHRGVS